MMANEVRLIDAAPLIADGWVLERHGISNVIIGRKSLADVPTIDPESLRPKAKWLRYTKKINGQDVCFVRCNRCRTERAFDYGLIYCNHCGAKMEGLGMKAWLVREKDEFSATVVFAETRGKARALAQHTEACEEASFCDIEVRRMPEIDKYYVDGKTEMCWWLSTDRVALVKDAGFTCDREYWEPADCEKCPAAEYCDMYKDYVLDREEEAE